MSWFDAARTRPHLLFARRAAEARIDEEMRFHVEMEAERLMRDESLDVVEANRRARAAFGGVTQHRETLRDGRGLAWIDGLSLDLKLAGRMLAKHPGLTFVAVVGLAVGVAIGATSFSALHALMNADLPISEGNRIIRIRSSDSHSYDNGRRSELHDLAVWRDALTTVDEIGAYRLVDRNLITTDGHSDPLRLAEMTATAFRIARVAPMLGRSLQEDDERPGSADVAVLGYDLWQQRFGGRRDILGTPIQLGDTRFTVVGVMPSGFLFPINNQLWTPLKARAMAFERGKAPIIDIFGRIENGASLDDVNRQLATVDARLARSFAETHANIRTHAFFYTDLTEGGGGEAAYLPFLAQLLIILLLVVIGSNVAILVYARTASRMGEIAVRSALGASRTRIIGQFFPEALMLSLLAAGVGVVIAQIALANIEAVMQRMGAEQMPFWIRLRVTPVVALYSVLLAIFCAVIVGVMPALKATNDRVRVGLQRLSAGGSAIQLGRTWTFLIVGQVAISVAILPVAIAGINVWRRANTAQAAVVMQQVLTATLLSDRGDIAQQRAATNRSVLGKVATSGSTGGGDASANDDAAARYVALRAELIRRIEAEPNVSEVVLSSTTPGSERTTRVELDPTLPHEEANGVVGAGAVDGRYFTALEVPLVAGRGFAPADFTSPTHAVLVNRSLARRMFGSANPLGRLIRETSLGEGGDDPAAKPKPWEEIVGVVGDFPIDSLTAPKVYRPLLATSVDPVTIAVRMRGVSAVSFGARLQQLTVETSPVLRVAHLKPLEQTVFEVTAGTRLVIAALELITLSTVLLSAAGIYALMSFTITRRRREIGIRTALGAGGRQMLMSILARAMVQVAIGIVIGITVAALIDHALDGGWTGRRPTVVLAGVVALMATIGVLAALRPAVEALRIQPTEALRSD